MERRFSHSIRGLCYYLLLIGHIVLNHHVVKSSWIDPDTNQQYYSTNAYTKGDDRKYTLVFSDEFETEGRLFDDGEDPKWTAIDKNDYTNDALHYYKTENVQTIDGVLRISTILKDNVYKAFHEKTKKYYLDVKHVQSGMVQGWNKFCMTGGIIEFSAKLPGNPRVGGYWPALWLLGNLARATYVGSSDWVWPFSYNQCDLKKVNQQEINACRKVGHYGMKPGIGRGAPEIDILEAMGGEPGKLPNTPIERPYFSSSLQVAPGVSTNRPILMHQPKPGHWYEGLEYGDSNTTSLNPFFYGVTLLHTPKDYTYQSDAISANTRINESFFKEHKIYRVEWEPPEADGSGGYIRWYLDGEFLFGITGNSLNITGASIPSEPMYLIMNTAVASSWGFPVPCPEGCDCSCYECGNPDCSCTLPTGYCENFPGFFDIDYVRVWQAKDDKKHNTGCSTEDRPTELFIKAHQERYMEEGDKVPLKDIIYGGARCINDDDCGGPDNGACSLRLKVCVCNQGFAGSSCLSYDGYDDNPYVQSLDSTSVSMIYIPQGLVFILFLLVIATIITLVLTVLSNRREIDYLNEQVWMYYEDSPLLTKNYDYHDDQLDDDSHFHPSNLNFR